MVEISTRMPSCDDKTGWEQQTSGVFIACFHCFLSFFFVIILAGKLCWIFEMWRDELDSLCVHLDLYRNWRIFICDRIEKFRMFWILSIMYEWFLQF